MFKRLLTFAAALSATAILMAPPTSGYAATSECHVVAAPDGSDAGSGTITDPVRSATELVRRLQRGQTGCFRSGAFSFSELKVSTAGVTLTSYSGDRATLQGRLWIVKGADSVTVEGLDLDGRNDRNLPSPTVNANSSTFRDVDVTNYNTGICFVLGSPDYGRARGTVIESSEIHNCGERPATNMDHGVYVEAADETIIRNNLIYDNADRGIQLYPDAQRTRISNNVIDGNGQGIIFSGGAGVASSNNIVEGNTITNSRLRHNVEAHFEGPVGKGNVVRDNCIYGAKGWYAGEDGSGIEGTSSGFNAYGNHIGDPGYADRAAKDFRLPEGSPCASAGIGAGTYKPASAVSNEGSYSEVRSESASRPNRQSSTRPKPVRIVDVEVDKREVVKIAGAAPTAPVPASTRSARAEKAPGAARRSRLGRVVVAAFVKGKWRRIGARPLYRKWFRVGFRVNRRVARRVGRVRVFATGSAPSRALPLRRVVGARGLYRR